MNITKVIPDSREFIDFDDGNTYARYASGIWQKRLPNGTWEDIPDGTELESVYLALTT